MGEQSFSDLCSSLGCPLNNSRWSWCAISNDARRAVFTIWGDEMSKVEGSRNRRYVLAATAERRPGEIPSESNELLGAREMHRIASYCADHPDVECLGILCTAVDVTAIPRQRRTFDRSSLFKMRVVRDDANIVAELYERVPIHSVLRRSS
jgi:hypothetical protein